MRLQHAPIISSAVAVAKGGKPTDGTAAWQPRLSCKSDTRRTEVISRTTGASGWRPYGGVRLRANRRCRRCVSAGRDRRGFRGCAGARCRNARLSESARSASAEAARLRPRNGDSREVSSDGRARSRKVSHERLYDIWLLATSFLFEGNRLVRAINATFERRETIIPDSFRTPSTPILERHRQGVAVGGAKARSQCRSRQPCRRVRCSRLLPWIKSKSCPNTMINPPL